jgi:hypothetical protein
LILRSVCLLLGLSKGGLRARSIPLCYIQLNEVLLQLSLLVPYDLPFLYKMKGKCESKSDGKVKNSKREKKDTVEFVDKDKLQEELSAKKKRYRWSEL